MTEFRYLSAAEWGGTWTTASPPVEKLPDGEAFLHHVGGAAWMGGTVALGLATSRAAAIAVFRGLNEYAKRPRDPKDGSKPPPGGWGKGYQFLDYDALGWYDRFNDIGWIGEGRGRYRSAATLDRNEEGEAFCLCGNFSLRAPLPAEIELCARGLRFMADEGWTTPTPTILGHKDNPAHPGATGCPGDHLYPHLPTIRVRFAALAAPAEPDPPTLPEDDMAKIAKIRFKGFADQFALIPLGPDTNRRLDLEAQAPIVVACVGEDAVEREVGYQLTPTANGQ